MKKILFKIWCIIIYTISLPFGIVWTFFIKDNLIKGDVEKSKEISNKLVLEYGMTNKFCVSNFIKRHMVYVPNSLGGLINNLDYIEEKGFKGGCEDYSMVAYRLLTSMGYKPRILNIFTLDHGKNHTICVCKALSNDDYFSISTEGIRFYFNTLNDLIKHQEREIIKSTILFTVFSKIH